MDYQIRETDENHEYARSDTYGGIIHITKVTESGRKDFTCLGCNKPMLAILRKIYNAKPYFRHDVTDVPVAERCTFKNETYRKTVALDTLQLEKQLRLPALYKLPPKGVEGLAIKLLDAQTVHFSRVKRLQHILESPDGNVTFNESPSLEGHDLLISPDAICYDEEDQPVLIVLISDGKRKKTDVDLLSALARLKINTVSITPAKSSPEEIHSTILSGKNTKWLYHDDERQFDYFSLSADLGERVPTTDVDQGHLYEETLDCRKVQISNLIRAINKCLAGESYRTTEENNRRFIGETRLAIGGYEKQWSELEEQYRNESYTTHSGEFDEIEARRGHLRVSQSDFSRNYQDLEERYFSKKSELREEARTVESNISSAERQVGGGRKPLATLQREFDKKTERTRAELNERFERELQSIESERGKIERGLTDEGVAIGKLRALIEKEPANLSRLLNEKRARFDKLEENERVGINKIRTDRENIPERFRTEEVKLNEEFEKRGRQSADAVNGRDIERDTEFTRRLKAIMDGRRYFVAIEDARAINKRIREAKRFFESAAGQAWLQSRKR